MNNLLADGLPPYEFKQDFADLLEPSKKLPFIPKQEVYPESKTIDYKMEIFNEHLIHKLVNNEQSRIGTEQRE
jgi:hypothetical protein